MYARMRKVVGVTRVPVSMALAFTVGECCWRVQKGGSRPRKEDLRLQV